MNVLYISEMYMLFYVEKQFADVKKTLTMYDYIKNGCSQDIVCESAMPLQLSVECESDSLPLTPVLYSFVRNNTQKQKNTFPLLFLLCQCCESIKLKRVKASEAQE